MDSAGPDCGFSDVGSWGWVTRKLLSFWFVFWLLSSETKSEDFYNWTKWCTPYPASSLPYVCSSASTNYWIAQFIHSSRLKSFRPASICEIFGVTVRNFNDIDTTIKMNPSTCPFVEVLLKPDTDWQLSMYNYPNFSFGMTNEST